MKNRNRWLAGLAGVGLLLVTATATLGYAEQVAGTVTVGTVGAVTCTATVTFTATVLETGTNAPIEGQPVTFTFTTSQTGDTIHTTTVNTNAAGVATTTITLECTPGNRTVTAAADNIVGSGVLGLTFAASAAPASGLPNTSTGGAEIPSLFAAALAMGSGGILLRQAVRRR